MTDKSFFTSKLLEWYASHHRPMPWKGEKNPYYIWLSEIILQQTTVRQGQPYYERFVEKYPTVNDLAHAPQDEVMKLWEGLGYYSRARNLHTTAQHIAVNLKGAFPKTYYELLTLKGVGTYTAAAIASFAYNLPHAVVDGNVYRVLSRFFGIEEPIDTPLAKKTFTTLANELLPKERAADFNQAMMDFGASQCVPTNPDCHNCIMQDRCVARLNEKVAALPIKSKKIDKKVRYFNYLVINTGNRTFVQKRTDKDIWQNLYEFPLIEKLHLTGENTSHNAELTGFEDDIRAFIKADFKIVRKSPPYKQLLTHRVIIATFWEIETAADFNFMDGKFLNIERKNLTKFAFPKVIDLYFQDKVLTLF